MKRIERGIWEKKLTDGRRKYVIIFYVNGKRHKETVGRDLKLARMELTKRNLEISQAKEAKKYPEFLLQKEISFDNLVIKFLKWSKDNKRPSTHIRNCQLVEHLEKDFNGKKLSEINPLSIEEYKQQRSKQFNREKQIKGATVNRELACLRKMFNLAKRWEIFTGDSPIGSKKVDFYPEPQTTRSLTDAEIEMVFKDKYCTQNLKNVLKGILLTGMSIGDLFDLKRSDINMQTGVITYYRKKTGGKAEIPINDDLKDLLVSLPQYKDCPYVFNNEGKQFKHMGKTLERVKKHTGIMDITLHSFRHTFGTKLGNAGIGLDTIAKLMGHKNKTSTLRYQQ